MKKIGGGQSMVAEHSHEEVWNLVPGLDRELSHLAHDLLPTMKQCKRLVIRIGAEALQGKSPENVAALAYELAAVATEAERRITNKFEGARGDGPIGQIVRNLKFLAERANHIATFGMDGESAKALRLGYRAFRNACALMWFYEFAPEGRPRFLRGAT
ncbi:MAG: hypothetical protein Q8K86_03675 [Candidatus Nanopelagicaceae bacterium]|nr:hypothetical protein [Candidatus Nanopelagicaceae bacterium]